MPSVLEDEMHKRRPMEASENRGRSRQGRGGTDLHRIDPDRVAQTLGSGQHPDGYVRLELMLNSILPRLVGEPPAGGAD
jgi:hypothetical protein